MKSSGSKGSTASGMDKVRVIERSLRCFAAGCLSLIPILGLLPAVIAIVLFHKALREAGRTWNPARGYLIGGVVLAWTGLTITLLAIGLRVSRSFQ